MRSSLDNVATIAVKLEANNSVMIRVRPIVSVHLPLHKEFSFTICIRRRDSSPDISLNSRESVPYHP